MPDFTKRFRRGDGPGTSTTGDPRGNVAVEDRNAAIDGRDAPPPPVRERDAVPTTTAAPADTRAYEPLEMRARQRAEFGGFNWGSAFFGWLVAIGLAVLLTAIVAAAGTAIGLTTVGSGGAQNNAETIGLVGGILLVAIAMIAYYCGGYVAGRMSRFDGARQGFGVWVFGLIVTVAIAAAGWIFGDKYNVLDDLNLPRIPVHAGDLTTGGLIALAAIVLGTLVAAIVGGKVGERFHRRVDRVGF